MLTFIHNPEQYVLPDLLDQDGSLRLLPASEYDKIEQPALQLWCHQNTRYGLPTTELVEWIQNRIGDRSAIEIGSGCGDLAKHLGIPGTDSKVQEKKWVQEAYRLQGQRTIFYPGWIKRLDALSAIERYEPQVVVASWVTQWVNPNIYNGEMGCVAGVKEDELLATGVEYIFVGNRNVHSKKHILSRTHEEHNLPFLRSRAAMPHLNVVYVWKGTR